MTTNSNTPTGFALDQTPTIYDAHGEIIKGFNDLYLDSGGNIATIGGLDNFMQIVKNALWLWIGEYEFDTSIGLSYAGVFDNNNAGIFTSQIETNLLNCNKYLDSDQLAEYGIKSINRINFVGNTETRSITIFIVLILNNGTTQELEVEQQT